MHGYRIGQCQWAITIPHGATLRARDRKRNVFHRNLTKAIGPTHRALIRTVTVSARAYAEHDVERGFDHVRYGYFEEVDTRWRNTGVSVEVLHDAAMVG